MFRIAKHIDFCYGHRLLDYEGKCAHPHGHNGRVEIELECATLDRRGMVQDFGDVKLAVKTWIDENLDHRMILRRDDPLVAWLAEAGEPHYLLDVNPTAESIARLIHERSREMGLDVVRVTLWETPTSWASYGEPATSGERRST